MAQVQVRAAAGARHRWIHRAVRLARRDRGAPRRTLRERQAPVCGQGRHGLHAGFLARAAQETRFAADVGVPVRAASSRMAPAQRYTKLDLARYHDTVAEHELPHLRGRPLTLVRCPKEIGDGCYFMKHSKVWAPEALRRVRIQEKTKLGEYLIADTAEAVIALAQMDVIEIHTWNSRD